MTLEEMFPGRFLGAGDLVDPHTKKQADFTLRIRSLVKEELEGDKGKEVKVIVSFENAKKSMVLNKTNALCIAQMFGRESNGWIGKSVTFFPTTAPYGGKTMPAVRVRGSPDIPAPITFDLKLPRKKPVQTTLQKTGAKTP